MTKNVLNRGRGRTDVFSEDDDYYVVTGLLRNGIEMFNLRLQAHSMSSHSHLLVLTPAYNVARTMR